MATEQSCKKVCGCSRKSVDSFASIKKSVDVFVRRNIWDCGAQAQDKCGRAGVGEVTGKPTGQQP